MSHSEEFIPNLSSQGRGRGRGGGVPVLPTGLWDTLSNDVVRAEVNPERYEDAEINNMNHHHNEPHFPHKRQNPESNFEKRGPAKDLKGVDWNCTQCDNLNWSWRGTCNKCNTVKPAAILTESEIRDGIGGGFMERQERASKATVEVDEDGFDDFGRRAKKTKEDRRLKEEAALKRLQSNYGFLLPQDQGDNSSSNDIKRVDDMKSKTSSSDNNHHKQAHDKDTASSSIQSGSDRHASDRGRDGRARDDRERGRERDSRGKTRDSRHRDSNANSRRDRERSRSNDRRGYRR